MSCGATQTISAAVVRATASVSVVWCSSFAGGVRRCWQPASRLQPGRKRRTTLSRRLRCFCRKPVLSLSVAHNSTVLKNFTLPPCLPASLPASRVPAWSCSLFACVLSRPRKVIMEMTGSFPLDKPVLFASVVACGFSRQFGLNIYDSGALHFCIHTKIYVSVSMSVNITQSRCTIGCPAPSEKNRKTSMLRPFFSPYHGFRPGKSEVYDGLQDLWFLLRCDADGGGVIVFLI